MTEQIKTKVLVVGGGPGGYVAAIRAGQLGLDTTLVEADRLGGTCLIRGCIPSKAIIHVAGEFETMRHAAAKATHGLKLATPPRRIDFAETVKWKEGIVNRLNTGVTGLLKRSKVRVVNGWAKFSDGKTCTVDADHRPRHHHGRTRDPRHGSLPVQLPVDPLRRPRHLVDRSARRSTRCRRNWSSSAPATSASNSASPSQNSAPKSPSSKPKNKSCRSTTRSSPRPSNAGSTRTASPSTSAPKPKPSRRARRAHRSSSKRADGKTLDLPADKILVTVGRKPNTEGWGLENMAVDMAGRFVKVDDHCRTSMKNVWAIGDLVGEPMLEHKAATQGEMVAEIIAGHKRTLRSGRHRRRLLHRARNRHRRPLARRSTAQKGEDIIIGQFPFAANGRALSMDAGDNGGFVRVVARKDDHRILGIQAVGAPRQRTLSANSRLALEMGAVLEDIAGTIHVHPTLSEAFHEAALKALGHAIHI